MQSDTKYNYGWRILHWLIAVLVLALIPVGVGMASGDEASFWKVLTDRLYNWHKAIGFAVLWLMVLRIAVKSTLTAPPYPGELSPTLVLFAKWLHHFMYMLLVMAPLIGWAGVTAYPALDIVGGYSLPPLPFVPQDEALAKQLFSIHGTVALTLAACVAMHIAAALKHLLVNQDGIFQRMWFGRSGNPPARPPRP